MLHSSGKFHSHVCVCAFGAVQYTVWRCLALPVSPSFILFTIFIEFLVNTGHCSSALLVLILVSSVESPKTVLFSHSHFSNKGNEVGWGPSISWLKSHGR